MARSRRTEPRKSPLQRRSQRTVDDILTATARILVRDGVDKLNTNRVAEVAGVTVGSVYQYFPAKEALVAALLDRHLAELRARVAEVFFSGNRKTPAALFKAAMAAYLDGVAGTEPLHRALLEQVATVDRDRVVQAFRHEVIQAVAAMLEVHGVGDDADDRWQRAFFAVHCVDAAKQGALRDHPAWLASDRFRARLFEMASRTLGPDF